MKILILSDIHGDYESFKKVIDNNNFDRLVVLGDLFSYGYFSLDFDNSNIIKTLQALKEKVILIKGNCDQFINFEEYDLFAHSLISMTLNNHVVTMTHGDTYHKGFLPSYHGNIIFSGHTHIPSIVKEKDIVYANPGSIGRPRGGFVKSYLVFEDNTLTIKDLNNKVLISYIL